MRLTQNYFICFILVLMLNTVLFSQIKDYRIHDRGMLHETVFNTGEIGRAWQTGEAGNQTSVPLMEWPSRSATIVNGIEYSGQHNLLGAGVYIGANLDGLPGEDNRLFALCGAVGSSSPEKVFNRWSFPLSIDEVENFPVLADGTINPDYNPDEAEEIITASWGTPVGITVTRTSRAWSFPDYDDFIIYEYTFEYTGDTDGRPATIEQTTTLKDVMVCFNYGFAPSMYGFQRWYQEWKYEQGIYRGDLRNYWDAEYWLTWNLNVKLNVTEDVMAKPEPNKELFLEFAQTGKNGGGLCSPQAPGWAVLYYDTTHLAKVVPAALEDTAAVLGFENESETAQPGRIRSTTVFAENYDPNIHHFALKNELPDDQGNYDYTWYFEVDENFHMKQPWCNKVSTGNTNSQKMMHEKDPFNPVTRWSGVYKLRSTTWADPPDPEDRWIGRAAFNYRQTADAGMRLITFGPYTLEPGDKIEFSIAEVIGYGAEPGKRVEGGSKTDQWSNVPSWNRPVVINGETVTERYIDDFGYPDYVNSDVVTVHDVTRKAFEAYLGYEPAAPVWPEDHPRDGVYSLPSPPPPAPALFIQNTPDARIRLNWKPDQENFPYLQSNISKYYIYRSVAGMGPWAIIDSIDVGQAINQEGMYEYIDEDISFSVGDTRFYAISSVDENGTQSSKSNATFWQKNIRSVEKMDKIHVVPNPFMERSGFQGLPEETLGFYGLPDNCTIRIYSYAGQLVDVIEHDQPVYSTNKTQVTLNHQEMASGLYFYVVTTPDGDRANGKFIIMK
jgi:hypothetical protein